jgi:hypothetical protein
MKSSGKAIGFILIGVGLVILLASIAWVLVVEAKTRGGAALGGVLALIIVAPLIGGGAFLLTQANREDKAMAEVARQRRLLGIIKAQGQVNISDLVLELRTNREQVRHWIYDLVDKGLFSGYINWDQGTLYSEQASQLNQETSCKHCGGAVRLAGKGVLRCPFCGTEYFIS